MAFTDKGIGTFVFGIVSRILFGKLTEEQKNKVWEKVKEAEKIAVESAAKGAAEGIANKLNK